MYLKITIKKEITQKAYEAAMQYLAFYRGTIYTENPDSRVFLLTSFIYPGNYTSEEYAEYTMKTIIYVTKKFDCELSKDDYDVEICCDKLFDPFGMYSFDIGQIHMYYRPPKLEKKIKWYLVEYHFRTLFEYLLGETAIKSFETKTCLSKTQTGLPMNIFIDDCKLYQKMGISKRIYFQLNKNDEINMRAICPVRLRGSIPKHHFETYCNSSYPDFDLEEKNIEELIFFVTQNKDSLEKVADQEISFNELKKMLVI